MTNIKTALVLLKNSPRTFLYVVFDKLNKAGMLHWVSDTAFLRIDYWLRFGKRLNLKDPQTFNEKLQWLKLHDRRPEYVTMVDKIAVKDYVAGKIGSEYIIPTLGTWDKPEHIDWESLPNQFVIKWNHDSGSIVICKDKSTFDCKKAIEKLSYGAKVNGFWYGREWPYKGVRPMLLAEKYIEVESNLDFDVSKNDDLVDYKFMCFNGEVKCCFTCTNRFSGNGLKVTFYDNDWNIMPFERSHPREIFPIKMPSCYKQMKEAAAKLSKGLPFARIDFYEIKEQPYFGEITLYPGSGHEAFQPEEWDYILGSWIVLPTKL